jgi:pSer/pThr/pTyr-binding forkhead associated (FHA) protein
MADTMDQTMRLDRVQIKTSEGAYATLILLQDGKFRGTVVLDNVSTVIGRSKNCTVSLETDTVASREHAKIRLDLETAGRRQYLLSDLGSTNGTYLNGKKIDPNQEVLLADGDRIVVGQHTLNFASPDAGAEKFLTGNISQITIFDLIQIVETNQLTATLSIRAPQRTARLFFNSGLIVDCEVEARRGNEAFKELVGFTEGFFEIERSETEFTKVIDAYSNTNLTLDTLREIDEENAPESDEFDEESL